MLYRERHQKPIEKTWFFIFYEGKTRLNLLKALLMRDGFKHVKCVAQAGDFVIILDPIHSHLDVEIQYNANNFFDLSLPAEYVAASMGVSERATVVKYTANVYNRNNVSDYTNLFPTCVTICKMVTGMTGWVFTPQQLFNHLLKNGGELYSKSKCSSIAISMERT